MLLKLMLCPVSNLCSATVDFSVWPRCKYLICSLCQVLIDLPNKFELSHELWVWFWETMINM
jgi:hypothetical protein